MKKIVPLFICALTLFGCGSDKDEYCKMRYEYVSIVAKALAGRGDGSLSKERFDALMAQSDVVDAKIKALIIKMGSEPTCDH